MEVKKVSLTDIDDDNSKFMQHLEKRFKDDGYEKRLEEIIAQSIAMHREKYGDKKE
jgi:hypothetical protein